MFIGYYELDGKQNFAIYGKCKEDYETWHKDTFSPTCKNIQILDFKISGKTFGERKNNLIELAKDWQYNFCSLDWSYGELYIIQNWLYENARRYGLVREFHENGIC